MAGRPDAVSVFFVDAHGNDHHEIVLLQKAKSPISLCLRTGNTAQPVMMAQAVKTQLDHRGLVIALEHLQRILRQQGGVRKQRADLDATSGEFPDDFGKVRAQKRLATGNIYPTDPAFRDLVDDMEAVF